MGSIKAVDCKHLPSMVRGEVRSYLEIGSFVGLGFRVLNDIFKPRLSVSIDPNVPHRVFGNPRNVFHLLNKGFSRSTVTIDAFWRNGETYVDASYFGDWMRFDLILIDGDHSYDAVKGDFFECLGLLSEGGTVLLHDVYTWKGVGRLVEELMADERFEVSLSARDGSHDGFCAVRLS